jgi:hypothetical protein
MEFELVYAGHFDFLSLESMGVSEFKVFYETLVEVLKREREAYDKIKRRKS